MLSPVLAKCTCGIQTIFTVTSSLVSIYRPLDWCKSTPLITTMNEMLWNVRLHYLRLSPAPSPAWSSRAVSGLATISMLSIALFQHFPTPPHVPVKWNVQIMLQSAHNLWSVVKILQLAINICSVLACLVSTNCDMIGRIDSSETEQTPLHRNVWPL